MRRLAACAALSILVGLALAGCAHTTEAARADEPSPAELAPHDSAPLVDRRAEFESWMREHYRPPPGDGATLLAFERVGEPLALQPEWTIDVQTARGHGGATTLRRFASDGAFVDVEEVSWSGAPPQREGAGQARARRTRVPRASCEPFVETVCLLPTVALRHHELPREDPSVLSGGGWTSSADFRILIRVCGADGDVLLERRYSGRPSSGGQLTYLPIQAAEEQANRVLARAATWTEFVPESGPGGVPMMFGS